jgi:hypothetical protein
MNVDTDELLKSLKSLKSLQVSPCECSAKNPDPDHPNQHAKACPRFQTMHCWCPPATGPGQSHLFGTFYRRAKPAAVPCTCKNWPGNNGWTHEAACPVAGAVMTGDEPYNLSEAEKHLLSAAVKSYVEADAALDVLVGEVAAKLQRRIGKGIGNLR